MSNQKGGIFNFFKKIECQRNNNKVFLESYKNGDLKTILFMIKKDMVNDYCVCDDEGNTVLHYAVINNDEDFIINLLESEKDKKKLINKQNNDGNTILHLAVKQNNTKLVDYLIEQGGDQTLKNKNGEHVCRKEIDNIISPRKINENLLLISKMTNNNDNINNLSSSVMPTEDTLTDAEIQKVLEEINDDTINEKNDNSQSVSDTSDNNISQLVSDTSEKTKLSVSETSDNNISELNKINSKETNLLVSDTSEYMKGGGNYSETSIDNINSIMKGGGNYSETSIDNVKSIMRGGGNYSETSIDNVNSIMRGGGNYSETSIDNVNSIMRGGGNYSETSIMNLETSVDHINSIMRGGGNYSETSILDSIFENENNLKGGNRTNKISGTRKIREKINLNKK